MGAALVTGGAHRLGQAICVTLAEMGYDIAIHHSSSDPSETEELVRAHGVTCRTYQANLTNASETSGLVTRVHDDMPHLDLLVNNASVFLKESIADSETSLLDIHYSVNVRAPFILIREFCDLVDKGQVINMADTRISIDDISSAAYSLSKKSLKDLTELAAVEFAPDIRVNAVAPGLILPPPGEDESYLDGRSEEVPLKRRGEPADITQALRFLLEAEFVTGQIIFVDGGAHL